MAAITFDIPFDANSMNSHDEQETYRNLLAQYEIEQELHRKTKEAEARRAALPATQTITLRIPTEVLERLDRVAADAGASRSQMLRQITSDFLNFVWADGVQYRGSTLSFRMPTEQNRNG